MARGDEGWYGQGPGAFNTRGPKVTHVQLPPRIKLPPGVVPPPSGGQAQPRLVQPIAQSGATPPVAYVRSRLTPSRAPVDAPVDAGEVMGNRRVEGSKLENQYGFAYLRRKKTIRPFDYTTDGAPPFAVPALATVTAIVTINKEADFELHKIAAVTDVPALGIINGRGDDFTFRIRDDRKEAYLSNGPIHNLCGTGSNIFPLVLPDTKFFARSTTMSIEMTNRRATAINVWWMFRGRNYYSREYENLTDTPDFARLSKAAKEFMVARQKKYIEPYFFTMDTTPVVIPSGGALNQQVLNIRQEGDFEVFAYTAFSTQGPFSWLARESNSGRFLMNRALASGTSMGDGERPALLPEPLFLDANSQLLIDFTDLAATGVANNVFLTLVGRKWFDSASLNLTAGPDFYLDKFEAL